MILLDAYALIAFLRSEPAAPTVRSLLQSGETAISVINLAEAVDVLTRRYGIAEPRLRATLEPLLASRLAVRWCATGVGWRAGELRARHYDRATNPLSLADCVLLATAHDDDSIATADPGVLAVAAAEQIQTVAL